MSERRYIISDASKMLDVESHVLRYWEEELEIKIPRNEMGHRYYTDKDIETLKTVRDLKRQGYGLRSIRMMINGEAKELPDHIVKTNKMEQFQEIMGNIVAKALKESGKEMGKELGQEIGKEIGNELSDKISQNVSVGVSESVIKEMDYRLRMSEEREEERYKRLDEAIRNRQKAAKKKKEKNKKESVSKGFAFFKKNKSPQTT